MPDKTLKYLRNIDPRTQWKWRLPHVKLVNNHEFYCNLVRGKSVLHVGFTDHKELIDIKMKQHGFLHTKLMEHAKLMHGVDINKEAITYLKDKYNVNNIYYCDITQQEIPDTLLEFYDIVLIPEVIEHVSDLGSFLNGTKRFMSPKSLLVIGTPNSFKLHNLFTTLRGFEELNPDHKYWFSYSTLKRLLEENGFVTDGWFIYIFGNPSRNFLKYGARGLGNLLKSLLIEVNHWFGDGIIVQAKLGKP